MFKVRAVHAEKASEATKLVEVSEPQEETLVMEEDVLKKNIKQSISSTINKASVAIRPSNYEKGYESDLY